MIAETVSGYGWQKRGLCRGMDPEIFFVQTEGEAGAAKEVCFRCPVRMPCLAFALLRRERFGIWGGLTERERRRLTLDERLQVMERAGLPAA